MGQETDVARVVLADEDADWEGLLAAQCRCEILRVHNRQDLLALLTTATPDVVLLDQQFDSRDGIRLCAELNALPQSPPIIILTAIGSIRSAIQATKIGAFDYLTKPPEPDQLRRVVEEAVSSHRLKRNFPPKQQPSSGGGDTPMIGQSPAIEHVRRLIGEVASTDVKVLVLGESGTGKELVARAIHRESTRREGPFVPINMAAVPHELAESLLFGHEKGAFSGADRQREGCCETADGGTLFLDEIGEMQPTLQAKLLRFLQDQMVHRIGSSKMKHVDVRVIAAMNRDPEQSVEEGRLREDLYHRLNVFPIEVPPLRSRREDIPLLVTWFLRQSKIQTGKQVSGFTHDAIEVLQRYPWPGNIRELENLVQRLVILARTRMIGTELLPPKLIEAANGGGRRSLSGESWHDGDDELRTMDRVEKQVIIEALSKSDGHVVTAAQLLGVGQATLYRKIKRYDIKLNRPRRRHSG